MGGTGYLSSLLIILIRGPGTVLMVRTCSGALSTAVASGAGGEWGPPVVCPEDAVKKGRLILEQALLFSLLTSPFWGPSAFFSSPALCPSAVRPSCLLPLSRPRPLCLWPDLTVLMAFS